MNAPGSALARLGAAALARWMSIHFLVRALILAWGVLILSLGYHQRALAPLILFVPATLTVVWRLLPTRAALIVTGALLLRLTTALAVPPVVGGDEVTYTARGILIQAGWAQGMHFPLAFGLNAYYYLSALIQAATGSVLFGPRIFNACMGTFLVFAAYQLALRLWAREDAALTAAGFTAIYPDLVYSSSLNEKDTLAALLVTLALLCVISRGFPRGRALVALLAISAGLFFLRYAYVAFLFWTAAFVVVARLLAGRGARRRIAIPSAALVATAICVGAVLLVPAFTDLAQQFIDTQFRNGSLGSQLSIDSSEAKLLDVLPYPDDLWAPSNYPVSLIRTVATPHPFYALFARDPASIVASLDGLIWHLTIPLAMLGVWHGRRDEREAALIIWVVATLLVLAVPVVALIGAPLRWRIPIMALYFCFAGLGLAAARADPAARRIAERLLAGWGVLLLALLAVYLFVQA